MTQVKHELPGCYQVFVTNDHGHRASRIVQADEMREVREICNRHGWGCANFYLFEQNAETFEAGVLEEFNDRMKGTQP